MLKKRRHKRMSSAANAVKHALSSRRGQFHHEMDRIEGEVNKQSGGVASFSSPLFVNRFCDEIERALTERADRAKRVLHEAVELQKQNITKTFAKEIKHYIRPFWKKETCDLREWYQRRVETANAQIAKERPFEFASEQGLAASLVDIENGALAPGFFVRNKATLVSVATAIVGWVVGLYSSCGKTH